MTLSTCEIVTLHPAVYPLDIVHCAASLVADRVRVHAVTETGGEQIRVEIEAHAGDCVADEARRLFHRALQVASETSAAEADTEELRDLFARTAYSVTPEGVEELWGNTAFQEAGGQPPSRELEIDRLPPGIRVWISAREGSQPAYFIKFDPHCWPLPDILTLVNYMRDRDQLLFEGRSYAIGCPSHWALESCLDFLRGEDGKAEENAAQQGEE